MITPYSRYCYHCYSHYHNYYIVYIIAIIIASVAQQKDRLLSRGALDAAQSRRGFGQASRVHQTERMGCW